MSLTKRMQPVRLELPREGEWVDLKPRMSKDDEMAPVQNTLAAMGIRLTGDQMMQLDGMTPAQAMAALVGEEGFDPTAFFELATWSTLERAIVAWSFYEGPPQPADVRDLEPADYEAIVAKCNELYEPPRKDEARQDLSGDGASPPTAAAGFPPPSDGSP